MEELLKPPPKLENGLALVSLMNASIRALEAEKTKPRLFFDSFAKNLAGELGKSLREKVLQQCPFVKSMILTRTKYFDDFINMCFAEKNIRQFVNLGCGMDTRAFRLNLPEEAHFYELDIPSVIAYKKVILNKFMCQPTAELHHIEADILQNEWKFMLEKQGFKKNEPSVWILEGVLSFLNADQVKILMEKIQDVSAPKSMIIFDILSNEYIEKNESSVWENVFSTPLQFGVSTPAQLLLIPGFGQEVTVQSFQEIASKLNNVEYKGPQGWIVSGMRYEPIAVDEYY